MPHITSRSSHGWWSAIRTIHQQSMFNRHPRWTFVLVHMWITPGGLQCPTWVNGDRDPRICMDSSKFWLSCSVNRPPSSLNPEVIDSRPWHNLHIQRVSTAMAMPNRCVSVSLSSCFCYAADFLLLYRLFLLVLSAWLLLVAGGGMPQPSYPAVTCSYHGTGYPYPATTTTTTSASGSGESLPTITQDLCMCAGASDPTK